MMDRGNDGSHPGLVIDSCASGGQRMDAATLAVHPVQSTSDNQDELLTAAIAASAPTAVTPEQGAVWAYPDPAWTDERIASSLANPMLGRVHLGGRLDLLAPSQLELVREALAAYRSIRGRLTGARPTWPLGLPGWHDPVVALGLHEDAGALVTVWRRGGPRIVRIPLPRYANRQLDVRVAFPTRPATATRWDAVTGYLTLELPEEPAARTLEIRVAAPPRRLRDALP